MYMKCAQNWLCATSLIMSAGALSLSIWTSSQADARAEQALRQRERRIIEKLQPSLAEMYQEFDFVPPRDPETLEELLEPAVQMITKLGATS